MKKRILMPVLFLMAAMLAPAAWAHGGQDHLMGTVKAVDASSITVETKDKKETKVLVDANTKFEKSGAAAALKDLSVGDRVVIHAAKKGSDLTAVMVKFGAAQTGHSESGESHAHGDASGGSG